MGTDFLGKKVLITGGSSGIGLATALKLASQGAHLWLLARDSQKLEAARTQVERVRHSDDQKVGTIAADVSNFGQISTVLNQLIEESGAPDIVVNAAGGVEPGYFDTQDLADFRHMMDIDFFGTLQVLKIIVPEMIKRKSGHIVNISSIAGLVGWYGYSAYGSAKYAVTGLSHHLRSELAPFGIKVTTVYPPDTDTPQLVYDKQHQPPEAKALSEFWNKPTPVDRVAELTVKGIARGQFSVVPGVDNRFLIFLYNNFPGLAFSIFDWSVRKILKQTNSTRKK
jgi:3-dehydrosphinganine reductase